jgi:hypothetical protein
MIVDALLGLVNTLLGWGRGLLPSWSISLPSFVTNIVAQLKTVDGILPVTEVLAVLSLYVTLVGAFSGVKWTVKLIDWIADVIP